MVKQLAMTVVVLVLASAMVYADALPGGIARELAMGGSNTTQPGLVLNPFIMNDPALLLLNPAYSVKYRDYVWSNIGGGTLAGLSTADNGYGNQNAGLNVSLSNMLTLGATLSYDPSAANQVRQTIAGIAFPLAPAVPTIVQRGAGGTPGGAQAIPAISNVFEVVAGLDFGTLDLGLGVMYGWSNAESKVSVVGPPAANADAVASASVLGLRGGFILDIGGGSALDGAAALRFDKATDKYTGTTNLGEYTASGTEFQVFLRGKFRVTNKFNFVPYGAFLSASAEPKEDTPPQGVTSKGRSEKYSTTAYALGVGGEYHVTSVYLAGGVSFQSVQAKFEHGGQAGVPAGNPQPFTATTTTTALPVFNFGAEWWMTDWLAARGGYFRSLASTDAKLEVPTAATIEQSFTSPNSSVTIGGLNAGNYDGVVTLGIGLKFGGFALDATVSEEALRRGLGLIGSQDNINTFGYLTAGYCFQ